MSGHVRPFRKLSVPRLVQQVIQWRGEPQVLKALAMELEFRRGMLPNEIKATLVKQLADADWDRCADRWSRWEACSSLLTVLKDEGPQIQSALTLLQAAGFVFGERSGIPAVNAKALRRAIAWNDGGRITRETGAPGSPERYRLLIELFTRAITRVRVEGLERGGRASDAWPQYRAFVVKEMQKRIRVLKEEAR